MPCMHLCSSAAAAQVDPCYIAAVAAEPQVWWSSFPGMLAGAAQQACSLDDRKLSMCCMCGRLQAMTSFCRACQGQLKVIMDYNDQRQMTIRPSWVNGSPQTVQGLQGTGLLQCFRQGIQRSHPPPQTQPRCCSGLQPRCQRLEQLPQLQQ